MNQETKITLRFYSVIDVIYVFSMFKLGGKINYINNLSYFTIFSIVIIPLAFSLLVAFMNQSAKLDVKFESKTILICALVLFLLKFGGMLELADVSYWWISVPVLFMFSGLESNDKSK